MTLSYRKQIAHLEARIARMRPSQCRVCYVTIPGTAGPRPRLYCSDVCNQRHQALVKRYRLSVAQYHAMLTAQGGQCAICRAAPATAIDHDHTTGKVRGILCAPCNMMLTRDNPDILRRGADYLEYHGHPTHRARSSQPDPDDAGHAPRQQPGPGGPDA